MQQQRIEKKLSTFSERVKMIDMHPKEALVLCSLYNGRVTLWNYEAKVLVKSFEVLDAPIRCVKFILRLQSFACGADDMNIRIYNYNTMEKTKTFLAHDDYLRSIAVHDQLPLMLTSSDDMRIKAWDWSKEWACTMIFEGHSHYVMQVAFNPKEPMIFASASLDHLVKVWNISNPEPFFSLQGHEDGVNCVEYYPGNDKPYLITGSDDHTVRVWDYQTRSCIQILTHHSSNVTCVIFHPDIPLIFSGGEDDIIGIINTQTWRQEQILNYGMQRVWTIAARPNTNAVAIGFDKGMVVLKVGNDVPILAMDGNGKLYQAIDNGITRVDIKNIPQDISDGEILPRFPSKELGHCESTPCSIINGPSGQFIAVITESGEYTVYSSLSWRPKSFGPCISFAWGPESGCYAVLENTTTLKKFKGFKPVETLSLSEPADKLFSGPVLGVRSQNAVTFLNWDSLRVERRIEGSPQLVLWSDSGELTVLILEAVFYVLRYNAEEVAAYFAAGGVPTEDGIDNAFEVIEEVEERVRQATLIGDCLVFINSNDRLNYYIGGEITSFSVVNRQTYLLGFIAKENRIFCIDKEQNITSYLLLISVIDYKKAIVREDFETAARLLPSIPESSKDKIALFLQARGHLRLALAVSNEDEHKFELAVQLGDVEVALGICQRTPSPLRWRQIGDIAAVSGMFEIAERAMVECRDLNGLLMFYSCSGDVDGVRRVGEMALESCNPVLAFTCYHLLFDTAKCTDILLCTKRYAEAAFYARTYCHHKVDEAVQKWKNSVAGLARVRESISDPSSFPNLFPNMASYVENKKNKPVTESVHKENGHKQQTTPSLVSDSTPNAAVAANAGDDSRGFDLLSPEMPPVPHTTPSTEYKNRINNLKDKSEPSVYTDPMSNENSSNQRLLSSGKNVGEASPHTPDSNILTGTGNNNELGSIDRSNFASPMMPAAPHPTPATNFRPPQPREDTGSSNYSKETVKSIVTGVCKVENLNSAVLRQDSLTLTDSTMMSPMMPRAPAPSPITEFRDVANSISSDVSNADLTLFNVEGSIRVSLNNSTGSIRSNTDSLTGAVNTINNQHLLSKQFEGSVNSKLMVATAAAANAINNNTAADNATSKLDYDDSGAESTSVTAPPPTPMNFSPSTMSAGQEVINVRSANLNNINYKSDGTNLNSLTSSHSKISGNDSGKSTIGKQMPKLLPNLLSQQKKDPSNVIKTGISKNYNNVGETVDSNDNNFNTNANISAAAVFSHKTTKTTTITTSALITHSNVTSSSNQPITDCDSLINKNDDKNDDIEFDDEDWN